MLGVRLLAIGSVVGAAYGAITGAPDTAGQDVALIGGSALPLVEARLPGMRGAPDAEPQAPALWLTAARADDAPAGAARRPPLEPKTPPRIEALASPSISRVEVASDGRVRFAGLGSSGAEISLRRNGDTLGSTVVDEAGNWQLEIGRRLATGEHRIEAVAKTPGGSRILTGSDVRIAIPRELGSEPVVAFERSGDEIERDRAAMAEARLRSEIETAENSAAPPGEPRPKTADKAPPKQEQDTGSGQWSFDSFVQQVQEWLAKANREYQREIVRRLQIPSPPPDSSADQDTQKLAKQPEAEQPRKDERRADATESPERAPARGDGTVTDMAKQVRDAAERAEAERIAAETAAAERAARDRVAAEKAAAERKAAERATAERVLAEREKVAMEKAAAEKAAAEKAAEKAAADKAAAQNQAAAEKAAAQKAAAAQRAADEAAAAKAAAEKAAAERAVAEKAAAQKQAAEAAAAAKPRGVTEVPEPSRRPAVIAGQAEERDVRSPAAPSPGRVAQRPIPEPSPAAREGRGGAVTASDDRDRDADDAPTRRHAMRTANGSHSACRGRAGRRVRPPATYTVASGDSLWEIASRHYGHGYLYPVIYRANTRKIYDPDLIYPCQRLFIPRRGR